jgi:hypothetical protein
MTFDPGFNFLLIYLNFFFLKKYAELIEISLKSEIQKWLIKDNKVLSNSLWNSIGMTTFFFHV